MTCGVYVIRNKATGEQYIGSSRAIDLRWEQHQYSARHNARKTALQRDMNELGPEAFEMVVLEACKPEERTARERYYIGTLNPSYNTIRPSEKQLATETTCARKMWWVVMGEIMLRAGKATAEQWIAYAKEQAPDLYGPEAIAAQAEAAAKGWALARELLGDEISDNLGNS